MARTVRELLDEFAVRRDAIHDRIVTAGLQDPLQAAVDYAELNRPAMYANTFHHGLVGLIQPWSPEVNALVAGGLLGPVAVVEGGTPKNLFRDSHTLLAMHFVESVSAARGSAIPGVSPYAADVVARAFPAPSASSGGANLGPYAWGTPEWALFMVGTSLALEHSAARSASGRDELGLVASRYHAIWSILPIDLTWLTVHSDEEEETQGTLEDEHLTFIRTAAETALEATGDIEPLRLGVEQWYALLEAFFQGWAAL